MTTITSESEWVFGFLFMARLPPDEDREILLKEMRNYFMIFTLVTSLALRSGSAEGRRLVNPNDDNTCQAAVAGLCARRVF